MRRSGEIRYALHAIEPTSHGRYVNEFFRTWESIGVMRFKQSVDSQLTHSAGASWIVTRASADVASTLEVDNLTDANVFDNFWVHSPRVVSS